MAIVAADALQPKAPAVAEPWRSVRAVLRLLHVCMQPVHIARKPLTNCIVRLCVCVYAFVRARLGLRCWQSHMARIPY